MGKALVIKSVDFSENKLDTIEYGNIIPCTSVSLSQNTISFSSLDSTVQLTAIKTPSNTTDDVSWITSDTEVATVVNGLVTCKGCGTATITAKCGEQSATCEVSATIIINLGTAFNRENDNIRYSGSIDLARNKDWIGVTTENATGKALYWSADNLLGGYRAFLPATYDNRYLIPIPQGANHIRIDPPTGISWAALIVADSSTKSKGTGADGNCASAVASPFSNSGNGETINADISSLTSANGFVVSMVALSGTAESISGDAVATFSKVVSA